MFVAAWIALGLAGALDHTIAEKVFGTRVDLVLPQLQYGYVMFATNPRTVSVFEYAGDDGVRHALADLVAVPAPGYKRSRFGIDVIAKPDYLAEVCFRATHGTTREYAIFVTDYEVDGAGGRRAARTTSLHCSSHGLVGAPR